MKLPENVVPMPAEQRAKLKELAQVATPGPWVVVPCIGSPANTDGSWPNADRTKWGQHCGVEQGDGYGRDASSIFYADSSHVGAMLQDADYIAAASPDVALAALRYTEHLEARVANYKRREARAGETWLITKQFITEQGEELSEACARLSTVEAEREEAARLAAHYRQLQQGHDAALFAKSQHLLQAREDLSSLRGAVTTLLEDLANGCAPVTMEPGKDTTPYWLGVNSERANTLKYAELKCKELGIEWPIKPIPYAGNLPSEPDPTAPLAAAAPPGLPEGFTLGDVWDSYCTRCGTHESQKDDHEGHCGMCDNPTFKNMPGREAEELGVKFDEWVEQENQRRSPPAAPQIELRAARAGFQSPEYAERMARVHADVESLEQKNPNRKTRPATVLPTTGEGKEAEL